MGSGFTMAQDLGVSTEEGERFVQGYMDGFPGLEANFIEAKKLGLKRGWIQLDTFTGKRYFFPHFEKMKKLNKEAMSYYGEDYTSLSKEEKLIRKEEVKAKYPIIKELWKEWGVLKGKLERASLNYRIQGQSATQMKLAVIELEENNTSLEEGVLLIVHDELVEEWSDEVAEEKSELTLKAFKKSGTYFTDKVEFTGTSEIGDYWIH